MNMNRCSHTTLREHLFDLFLHPLSLPCKREKTMLTSHLSSPVSRRQTFQRPHLPTHAAGPDMGQLARGAGHGPGTAHKGKLNRRFVSLLKSFISSTSTVSFIVVMMLTILSVTGNKKDNITVIYTPWSNLKKDGSMDVGQVSFHDQRKASHTLFLFPSPPSPLIHTYILTHKNSHI